MDELDKNIPDDFWRKAFDEASEAPPPRVWSTIERRLDESNGPKIIPLWSVGLFGAKPLAWGAGIAAALALLVVGWWSMREKTAVLPVAQSTQPINRQHEQPLAPATDNNSSRLSLKQPDEPGVRSLASMKKSPSQEPGKNQRKEQPGLAPGKLSDEPSIAFLRNRLNRHRYTLAEESKNTLVSPSDSPAISLFAPPHSQAVSVAYTSVAQVNAVRANEPNETQASRFEKLALRPMKFRSPGAIQRIVWFRPAELPLEPKEAKLAHQAKEVWASVSMMPGAFNPSVSIRSAQTAAFSNAAVSNQPVVNSRANFSVAYQAGAGVQLTDRWSVESGIGYLSAHSSVESPGQYGSSSTSGLVTTANRNSTSGNLFANSVRNSISSADALVNASASTPKPMYDALAYYNSVQAYDARNQQNVTNNYEFVQVPVQVGYQLRPRKRLSMALLGGLLTNIFVRNTVGDDLVVTGKDGVYRPLSLAATMGARFRYRPSHRWSASLAGMYQPSLGVSTRPESQVQSSPTSAGMSFGLDYHF